MTATLTSESMPVFNVRYLRDYDPAKGIFQNRMSILWATPENAAKFWDRELENKKQFAPDRMPR